MAQNASLFQQGEPLNIDALNQLYNDIVSATASIATISGQNATITNSLSAGVPIIATGRVDFGNMGAAKLDKRSITAELNGKYDFAKGEAPFIVASASSALNANDILTVSVQGGVSAGSANYNIYVATGPKWSGPVYVNWIAVYFRAI